MIVNFNNIKFAIAIFFVSIIISSCNDAQYEPKNPDDAETMNSGKMRMVCDVSLMEMMDTVFTQYQAKYPYVVLTKEYANARQAMSELLSGQARAVVLPRDYLPDEDTLMQEYSVPPHYKFELAYDALVFFTLPDFPLDTLNDDLLYRKLTNTEFRLKDMLPILKSEPEFAIFNQNSSEYANLKKLVAKDEKMSTPITLLDESNTVFDYVLEQPNRIGITYLSKIANDKRFKLLRLGFSDVSGNYFRATKPVHQGYIIQDMYPFKVPIYVYLLEERKNLPFWFASYVAKESHIQEHYLKSGIVPAFAKVKLKLEEK